jgi:hypothetical protein
MGFSRRTLLAGLVPALLLSAKAASAAARIAVKHIDHSHLGTTLDLSLPGAPFPDNGRAYHDATVLVFVPLHYRPDRALDLIVHFHGHNTTARTAMTSHQLREQLWDSKQNAILVVPQGPVDSADSSIGKLERPGGFGRMLRDVRAALSLKETRRALEARAPRSGAAIGTVCVSAHSGGYHAAARAISVGGIEVKEVYLFDALYNEADVFRNWLATRPIGRRRKLVTYFGQEGAPAALSEQLYRDLTKLGVTTARETTEGTLSRGELVRAQAVFVRSGVGHHAIVHERNALRDCLYASSLRRHLRSAWFDNKQGRRGVESR